MKVPGTQEGHRRKPSRREGTTRCPRRVRHLHDSGAALQDDARATFQVPGTSGTSLGLVLGYDAAAAMSLPMPGTAHVAARAGAQSGRRSRRQATSGTSLVQVRGCALTAAISLPVPGTVHVTV